VGPAEVAVRSGSGYTAALYGLSLIALLNFYYLGSFLTREVALQVLDLQVLRFNQEVAQDVRRDALVYGILSLLISAYLLRLLGRQNESRPLAADHRNGRRGWATRLVCALGVLAPPAVYLLLNGPRLSYEGFHAALGGAAVISKLLYATFLAIGLVYGKALRTGALAAAVAATVGMRSFIALAALTLIVASRLTLTRLAVVAALLFVGMALVSLVRSPAEPSLEMFAFHAGMAGWAAASQVDLFFIASDVGGDSLMEALNLSEEYLSEGGGVGTFLPLELARWVAPHVAMALFLALPLGFLLALRAGVRPLWILCFSAFYVIAVRNPASSWISGFAVFSLGAWLGHRFTLYDDRS